MRSALIAITVLVTGSAVCAQQDVRTPENIRVVRSWGQLRGAPVMVTTEFGDVRVGIEAVGAPQWNGVLVYCLLELNPDSSGPHKFQHSDVLGPIDCRIHRLGAPMPAESTIEAEAARIPRGVKDVLYCRAVFIDQPGDFHVQISPRGQPAVIAEAKVRGTAGRFHAWVPFDRGQRQTTPAPTRSRNEFVADLLTRAGGIALPIHEGMYPYDWSTVESPRDDRVPLPRLVPSRTSPGLRLTGDGGELLIESDIEMGVARPDQHFLARWWVNGKPFAPQPIPDSPVAAESGRILTGHRLRIHLNLDPAHVGARRGDKIALQLLHLPHGWQFVGLSEALMVASSGDHPYVARLSNRMEFRAR